MGILGFWKKKLFVFLPDAVSIVKGRKASANGLDWTDIPMEI